MKKYLLLVHIIVALSTSTCCIDYLSNLSEQIYRYVDETDFNGKWLSYDGAQDVYRGIDFNGYTKRYTIYQSDSTKPEGFATTQTGDFSLEISQDFKDCTIKWELDQEYAVYNPLQGNYSTIFYNQLVDKDRKSFRIYSDNASSGERLFEKCYRFPWE